MKPILFNSEMVRAILDGRKTVTRRIIKPQPHSRLVFRCMGHGHGKWGYPGRDAHKYWDDPSYAVPDGMMEDEYHRMWTPPCNTGDILYVRETWKKVGDRYYYRADFESDYLDPCETISGGYPESCRYYPGCVGCTRERQRIRWYPSIHMPKEAARIFLRVKSIRVERLKAIDAEQAKAEGIRCVNLGDGDVGYSVGLWDKTTFDGPVGAFANLWDSTIKPSELDKYGWNASPWVWVIEFERCEKPQEV